MLQHPRTVTSATAKHLLLAFMVMVLIGSTFGQVAAATDDSLIRFDTVFFGGGSAPNDLSWPYALDTDSLGNFYVAEYSGARVHKIGSDGSHQLVWGSRGDGDGQFKNPGGIAVGNGDAVYVSDVNKHCVQKFSSTGVFLGTTGSGLLTSPEELTVGPDGNIYVASTGADSVAVFTPDLNLVFSWPVPDPVTICYDPVAQLVYVGQQWSKLVHSYRTDGTLVATYNTEGLPRSIATDQLSNIYIGGDNNRLYKYDANFVKQYEWSFFYIPQGLRVIGETVYLADGMDEIFKSRVASADNNLSSLSVDGQAISLASTDSSITVSSVTSSVNIVATAAAGSLATIKVNGTAVDSGANYAVAVAAGENPISIEVTAESGDKKTYTVTVTRSVPPDIVVKRLLGGYYWYDGGCYDDGLYFGGDGEAAISFDLTAVSGTVLEATLNAKVFWGWSNLSPEHPVDYSIYGTSEDSWFGTDAFPSTRQEPPLDQGTLPAPGADYWLSFAGAAGFVQQQLVPGDGLCSFILGSPDVSGYYAAVYDSTSSLPDQPYLSIRLAAIDLATATFDRNVANQADVSFNVILSDSVSAIKLGTEALQAGVDYTISGSTVTISKLFLASLPDGANVLTVEMNACSPQSLSITVADTTPADALPPVVGGSGVLTTSNLTDRSLDLGWTAASDDTTEAASLQYRVVRATDSIDTLAEADAAEEVAPWTANLTSQHVDGLYGGTAYNFAVIVRDGVGNRALYTSLPVSTPRTPITVTALAQSKVYGASDPADLEYQVTGSVYGGDAFSGALVRAAGEAADSYSISIGSLAIAPHPERYELTFSGSNFTITPRVLTVTADSVQKTYGEENPDLSVSYSGFVSGEDSSVLGGSLALTTAATTSSGAGVYSITPSGLTSSNYAISFVDGELQVNQALLTVTADNKSRVYGDTDPAFTYQVTAGALINGDTLSGTAVRTAGNDVGSYAIERGTLTAGSNYLISYVPGVLVISQRPITVSAETISKAYGESDPVFTYQISSGELVDGDAFSGALTRVAGNGVGDYQIQLGSLSAGSNYALTYVPADLKITRRPISASGVGADDKVYDRSSAASLTLGGAGLDGLVTGDDVVLQTGAAVGTFADRTAGNNKTVTVTGLALSGTDVGNYELQPYTTTATITQKPIEAIGVAAQGKVYDGTTNAVLDKAAAGLSGVVDGDIVSLVTDTAVGNFASKNVGSDKAVTVTGLSLSGVDAGNYVLQSYTTTAAITVKTVEATGVSAQDRVYDRTTNAVLDKTAAGLGGVVDGDDLILVTDAAVGAFANKNAGVGKTVTVAGLALSGADAENYALQPYTTTATITSKAVDATGITAGSKVYDGSTNAALDKSLAGLSGVVDGDALTLVTNAATGSFADKSVGADKTVTVAGLTLDGVDAGNYALQPYTTTAAISVKTVEATGISAQDRAYDRTTTASLDKATAGLSGVVDGDDVVLVTDAITGTFEDKNVDVGKTVTVAGLALSGVDAGNYVLQPYTTAATITAKAVDVTGIVALGRTYDGTINAALDRGAASLSGVVDGDDLALVTDAATGTFADKNVGTGRTVTVAGLTLSGVDAGNYALQPYTTAATITAKAVDAVGITALDRVYDGTINADLEKTAAGLSGVVDGDDLALVTDAATGSFAGKTVGADKTVTVAGLTLSGVDAGNYALQPYSTAATITAKPVDATDIAALDRVYDGTINAALDKSSAGLSGVVDGDGLTLVTESATGTFADKNVATGKAVTVAGLTLNGADAGNYVLQPYTTTATITAKAVDAVGITAFDRVYDGTINAALDKSSAGLSGVVDGDGLTLVRESATGTFADKNVGTGRTVTVAGLTLSGADAGNYALQPYSATATITAKLVDAIGISALDRVYDGTISAGLDRTLAGLSGVVDGDSLTLVTDAAAGTFADKNVATGKAVTVAGLTLSGVDVGNYALQPYTTAATITAKPVDAIGISALDRVYDGANNAALDKSSAGLSGVVDGDSLTLVTDAATATFADKNVGTGRTVTVAGLTLSGVDAGNYALQPYTTTATITAKAVDATGIAALDRVYDGSVNAALDKSSAALSGVVDGDGLTLVTDAVTGTFADRNVGVGKTVTLASLTLSGADASNYALQPYTTTAAITAKAVNATGIAALDRVYDGSVNAALDKSSAALSGVVDGDGLTLVTDAATATFADKNVGTGRTVTVAGLTLSGVDAGNYALQPYTTSATITAKAVDATGIAALDRVYDGSVNAALDKSSAGLSGVVDGDGLTLVTDAATGTFADKNVGVGKAVTVAGLTLSGVDAGNYALQPYSATATITAKAVNTTGIAALDRVYDGSISAALEKTAAGLSGVVDGDDLTLVTDAAAGTFVDKNAGAGKTVTVADLALSGVDSGNYSLQPYTTMATISPKPLSVSGIVALSKYADGNTVASLLTGEASLVGVLPDDDVRLDTSQASGSFSDALIGVNKPVAVTGLVLTGAMAESYQLSNCTATASILDEPEPPKPPTPPTPPAGNGGVAIIVNGEVQDDSATANTVTEDDKTVTTVVVDPDKLTERLEREGDNATVTLPVNTGADLVIGELTGQTVKNMEAKSAVLEIRTERVAYTLPASQISIDSVAEQLGDDVGLQDVKVSVHVAEPPADTVRIIEDTADRNNYQVVVKPVEFTITCTHEDRAVEVSKFSGYVERMVAIPDGIDHARVTTGVVLNEDGTFSHVPTTIVIVDGKYYAKINSLTNSVYSVIWNPVEFQDIEGHWAKGPVNDMASRLVMAGETSEVFGPNKAITRGEFAATIVKALGLRAEKGDSPFVDLQVGHRYYGHILTAREYRIMGGLPGNAFGAERELTREEAMAIVVSAMRLTELSSALSAAEVDAMLMEYVDSARVSGWARNVVAACLKSGIIGGRPGQVIAPKDIITRAEAAAIMQRFLRQAGLI